jgi:hypothetical protein
MFMIAEFIGNDDVAFTKTKSIFTLLSKGGHNFFCAGMLDFDNL